MVNQTDSGLLDYKPKHVIISDIFRDKITKGRFCHGDKLLPDEEIAKKYNVNKRTVAAGLNILVKEGLLERAPRRGTIVTKRDAEGHWSNNAVGMVMLSNGDVYSEISRHIARGFANHKLFPVLINRDVIFDDSSVVNFLKTLNSKDSRPYGFIIDGSLEFPFEFLKKHLNDFHNIVFINKYHHHEKLAKAKYSTVDYRMAGRIIAEHFIQQGHRTIAQLGMCEKDYAGPWSSIQVQIYEGITDIVRQSNLNFIEEPFWKLLHGAPLEETVQDLMSSSNPPDAIFAYNDAFIHFKLLPLLGNTAGNMELIGFYNTTHAVECGFSSIAINEKEIAENAIKLLTGKTAEKNILIKPKLVRH